MKLPIHSGSALGLAIRAYTFDVQRKPVYIGPCGRYELGGAGVFMLVDERLCACVNNTTALAALIPGPGRPF